MIYAAACVIVFFIGVPFALRLLVDILDACQSAPTARDKADRAEEQRLLAAYRAKCEAERKAMFPDLYR